MKAFAPYRAKLDALLNESLHAPLPPKPTLFAAALDGQPATELRRLVSVEEQRTAGAFFTGSRLSKRVARRIQESIRPTSVILDPACGVGDLLLACAAMLPVKRRIEVTLDRWAGQLRGRDVHKEFVLAARTRLALAAVRAGAQATLGSRSSTASRLTGIRVGCGLTDSDAIAAATHIVMNPPFSRITAPEGCEWAGGTINAASLFLEACVKKGRPGTRIVALLPDVLRSGFRYEKWRGMIAKHARIVKLQLLGQFDRWADVDVFLLDLELNRRRARPAGDPPRRVTRTPRLGDHFSLSVGPVVDYRAPKKGRWHPFIRACDVAAWETIRIIPGHRRFAGRVVMPPFVVVRRTSRRGDKARAVSTIIAGSTPVAVENHLLILQPKQPTIAACRQAIKVLKTVRTTTWLDRRIRCRHLTLQALAELPWILI